MSTAPVVARNSLFGVLALGIDKVVFMGITLALARYLGTVDFGRYAFVMTYLVIFQFVSDLGVEMILVRRAAQEPAHRDYFLANGFAIRFALSGACWLAAAAAVPLVADGTYVRLVLLAGMSLIGNTWMAYKILYRSIMRIEYLLLLMSVNALVTATGVGAVIVTRGGLSGCLLAVAAGSLCTLPFGIWLGRRFFRFRLRFDAALWASVLREALPLGINVILVSVSLRVAPLILIRLSGPAEVAYFAAASKLVEAFCLLPEVPMLTIFPMMAALHGTDPARLVSLSRTATKWIVVLLLPLVLLVSGVAPPLMRIMYGETFLPAAAVLQVLVWATAFSATGMVWIGVLTALGLQRFLMWFYGAATVVNVALCFALVPSLRSTGAALAAVLAAGVSQALLVWLPLTARYIRPAFAGIVPPLLVTIALTAAIPRLPLPPLPATGICLLLYGLAVTATGTVGAEERALARRIISRSGAGAE